MNANQQRIVFAILLLATLSACTSVPPAKPQPDCSAQLALSPLPQPILVQIVPDPLVAILHNYDALRQLPAAQLGQEYQKTVQEFTQTSSNSSRIRLAILLTLSDTSFHDITAALNLLTNWPKTQQATDPSLAGFAHMLSALLQQQQRATSTVSDLAQKLKEQQNHADQLQSKIDAIKSMEKNLVNGNKQ